MNEKSGDDWVALAAYEISKWAYSRTAGCNLSIDELAAIITKHFPSGDVGKLREALERLASICTCARPSLPNPGGAVVAPGPHTAKCVCTIARAALASVPANPPQVDTNGLGLNRVGNAILCYAWGETDRPDVYIAKSADEVRRFLIAECFGDGKDPSLEEWMQQLAQWDWQEESQLQWDFEIGGVRLEDVAMNDI